MSVLQQTVVGRAMGTSKLTQTLEAHVEAAKEPKLWETLRHAISELL